MKVDKVKDYSCISLDFIKKHIRLDEGFTDDDAYIQILIKSAVKTAENYINSDIAYTTNTILEKDFASSYYYIFDSNFINIVGITAGTTTLTSTDYSLYKYEDYSIVEFNTYFSDCDLNLVYTSGFAEGKIDEAIQHAIAVKVSELYDVDRQGYVQGSIKSTGLFEKLLNSYKRLV